MNIIPIKYAESTLPESMIFENGAKDILRPISFIIYLIESQGKRILVDAGCETMPGFDMRRFVSPISALKDIGISPNYITDLIITHAHHDHIECAKYFESALIHIQSEEYVQGKRYLPENTYVNIFEDRYSITPEVTVVKIGGHTNGSCVVEVSSEENVYVIVGDECYSRECIYRQIPTGSSKQPEKSKGFIEKYSDTNYKLLFCHDE